MSIIKLFTTEIADRFIQENFRRLSRYFQDDAWRKGNWSFVEYQLTAATYPKTIELTHRLGFVPKDVLSLSVSPDSETVLWNTDSFTRTTLSVTVTAACTVRAYIGRYEES